MTNRSELQVAFVPTFVVEVADAASAPGGHHAPWRRQPIFGVELELQGDYKKHNNNDGNVATARATPQVIYT